MSLLRKIKSMIRRAVVSLSLPDTGDYPIVQIGYLGKTANAEAIWPYGMGGRLPKNAQVFCFNIEGMEENKAGIGTAPTVRFKVDDEGETYFGNPITGSVTYYRSNGDIETIGKNNQSITISSDMNITVAGDVTINATGKADFLGSAVNLADLVGKLLMTDDIISIYNGHVHLVSGSVAQPTVQTFSAANATTKTKAS